MEETGKKLRHNGHYAKYVILFLKDKDFIPNRTLRLDKYWEK